MKHISLGIFLILLSCTARAPIEEVSEKTDTLAVSQRLAVIESPANFKELDFPLDSLLTFDSEEDLKIFFRSNIKRSVGYMQEGMGTYRNTLLFPDTENVVEFVWNDTVNFSGLSYIKVYGEQTVWKTAEGITLGTSLKELEKLNQKAFTFYGFGWDYSGTVNWNEGHLYHRSVFVCLDYLGESIPPEFDELIGDHEILSNSALAQKANPVVCEIIMRKQ